MQASLVHWHVGLVIRELAHLHNFQCELREITSQIYVSIFLLKKKIES